MKRCKDSAKRKSLAFHKKRWDARKEETPLITLPSKSQKNSRGRDKNRAGERKARRMEREVRLQELAQERAREAALERLVAVLEGAEPHPSGEHLFSVRSNYDALSRLARLRAAHAAYALANSGDMERVGSGAFVRHRAE